MDGVFRRKEYRFVRSDPVTYSHETLGGGIDLFSEYVPGMTVQYSDLDRVRGHPDGMVVDGAVNLRGSTLEAVLLDGVVTRYDLHAPDLSADRFHAEDMNVGRDLVLSNSILDEAVFPNSRIARYLDGRDLTVDGDVSAENVTTGRDADFSGGRIGGDLLLNGADLPLFYLPDEVGGVIDLRNGTVGTVIGDVSGHRFRYDDRTNVGTVDGPGTVVGPQLFDEE